MLDELDSTVHPSFLPEILRWFQDPKENPNNAQLWMSGHNASLLESIRASASIISRELPRSPSVSI